MGCGELTVSRGEEVVKLSLSWGLCQVVVKGEGRRVMSALTTAVIDFSLSMC